MRAIYYAPSRSSLAGIFALIVLSGACGSGDGEVSSVTASGQLGLVRSVSWPGGGRELTIKVQDERGLALAQDLSAAFSVTLDGDESFSFEATQEAQAPHVTAIFIVPPADADALTALQGALHDFLDLRPAAESIALYVWLGEVRQMASFTSDRQRLQELLDGLEPGSHPAPDDSALAQVEELVLDVAGAAPRGMRAVAVAGVSPSAMDAAQRPSSVPIVFDVHGDPAGASAELDRFALTSFYRVALCGPTRALTGELAVQGLAGALPLSLPASLPETASARCDPGAIGPGLRAYPARIELVFDPAQRAVYDQRVVDNSKADFALSVRLDDGDVLLPASAHLRGKGSLGCERKSYTVTLDGPGRHLLPDSRTDEFYLISMCGDDRYVEQFTANQLMSELGLFPLKFRYVEVLLDGATMGVYLLLEKAREELVRDNARVHGVIRRRFAPPNDQFELKWAAPGQDPAGSFESAQAAIDSFAMHTDLDQYLRFVALMTAFENGDYVDEIWVHATEMLGPAGAPADWFTITGWDNDDLFSECHYQGMYAFDDPNGLVYCAEARVDQLLLSDPQIYDRYVDILEDLLVQRVTPERFEQAAMYTRSDIVPMFSRPEICAAMVRLLADNPAAVDPQEAQRDIQAKLDDLGARYRARHTLLLERIQTYRNNP